MVDPDEMVAGGDGRLTIDDFTDRLSTFHALRHDDDQSDQVLAEIGGRGTAERDIVRQLAVPRPLYRGERFEEASRLVVRSLEVLDRNGARAPRLPKMGPAKPVATYVVQQITRFIVKSYQNSVVNRLSRLYERREAQCEPWSDEHRMLRRARADMHRIEAGFKGRALGLPTFLLGGAFVSLFVSALQSLVSVIFNSNTAVIIATIVLCLLFSGVSWCALRAAAIARHRIRLTLAEPMAALYQVVGAAGDPPEDQARQFAIIAVVIGALAILIVPIGLSLPALLD
jgi:hypothetical protein